MLRTTVIRGSLFLVLAALGLALWWAQSYVRPEAVRATVIESFADQFPDAHVQVAEAHLRVFGGVSVRDLSLARSGDDLPFFAAPTALISHDKEQLSNGRMVIRKIELEGPTLRLERRADGRWTFDGLSRPSPADRPVPMFVVNHGTIILTDKSQSGLPPLTFTDATFTLINDPPPLFLNVKGSALLSAPVPGATMTPVRVELSGRIHRLTGEFTFRVHAADVAIGPDLAALLRAWQPQIAERLATVTAKASVQAEIGYKPDAAQPLTYDVEVKIRDGRCTDPRLPVPAEGIAATVRFKDGKLTVDHATARLGTSTAEVTLETRLAPAVKPIPPASGLVPGTLASTVKAKSVDADPLAEIEQHLEKIDLTLRDLTLDDELYRRLGDSLATVRRRFSPIGVVSVSYHFSRPSPHGWRRDFELKPTRFGLTYEKFRYPLTDLTGSIRKCVTSSGTDETAIDLTASAAGQRIDIKGTVTGRGEDPGIDVRVSGNNVPIDDRLCEAFPQLKHRQALRKLRAVGRADFVAEVKQELDANLQESTFRFKVYDTKFSPMQFPYPLENVAGQITVTVAVTDPARPLRPGQPLVTLPDTDRVILSDFRGTHGKGTVTFKGVHAMIPNEPDSKFTLHVAGQGCPIDADFHAALKAIKLDAVSTTFSPRGALTFAVDVDVIERAAVMLAPLPPPFNPNTPPGLRGTLTARPKSVPADAPDPPFNPATDLKMTLHFTGPSVTPDFFPYDLDAVAGRVRYDGTQVRVEKFTATHGASTWALDAGEVRFFKDGRVWANIGKLDVTPVNVDDAFLKALPATLEKAVRQLKLKGNAELTLRHLVVLTPPDAPGQLPHLAHSSLSPATGESGRGEGVGVSQTVAFAVSQAPNPLTPTPLPRSGGEGTDPDIYWTGEIKLNGASLDAGVEWTNVMGRMASTGRYYGTHLGEVVGNIWLDDARAIDQPLKNVKIAYRADPQVKGRNGDYEPVAVKMADITGNLFGGTVGGEARLVLSEPVVYRLRLDATDINIGDLARHHNMNKTGSIEGTGQASLRLENRVTELSQMQPVYTLEGAGTFDIDRAHILNLPFLLPLFKTLKLQAPDKTAFEEAHADFKIRGDRVTVTHLDLLGDAVSIGGSGELDTSGKNVKFDCYTIWSQTLHRWLTTPFGDVSAFLSEKLFRIEITSGNDGKLNYEARLMPVVTDPVRAVAERMKRRKTMKTP